VLPHAGQGCPRSSVTVPSDGGRGSFALDRQPQPERTVLLGSAALTLLACRRLMLCAAPHDHPSLGLVMLRARAPATTGLRWFPTHRVLYCDRVDSADICSDSQGLLIHQLVVANQISDTCEHCDIFNSCRQSLRQAGLNHPGLKIFCRIT
jgi:hypothetical protein